MKARDHEKEMRRLVEGHQAERRLLLNRIAELEAQIETLRTRAQKAEQDVVEMQNRYWDTGEI